MKIEDKLSDMKLITVNDYTVCFDIPIRVYDSFRNNLRDNPKFNPEEQSVLIEFEKHVKN